MTSVDGLEELRQKARQKLNFETGDNLQFVESATGADIDDDECLFRLNEAIFLTVINKSLGEIWCPPQPPPWNYPGSIHHVLASSDVPHVEMPTDICQEDRNVNIVILQAQRIHMGDKNVTLFGAIQRDDSEELN